MKNDAGWRTRRLELWWRPFAEDVDQVHFQRAVGKQPEAETKVSGAPAEVETTIHHVWFHGHTQVGDVELRL